MASNQKIKPIILLTVGFAIALQAHAEIYRSVDSSGATSYSDRQTQSAEPVSDKVKGQVNFYSPPETRQQASEASGEKETVHDLSTTANSGNGAPVPGVSTTNSKLTEEECQEIYGLECDQVVNWKKYALEKCGNDERCQDPDYLDRKYRPRSISEMLAVAHRAGTRKNRQDRIIQSYITRQYSNLCRDQVESYCADRFKSEDTKSDSCVQKLKESCEVEYNLNDFLTMYKQLTPVEKEKIIRQAKTRAMEDDEHSLNYAQILDKVFDIYLTQFLSGI